MKIGRPSAMLKTTSLAALAMAAAAFVVGCGGGGDTFDSQVGGTEQAAQSTAVLQATLATIAPAALSSDEAASLAFMREEEKLARDVYAAMYSRWGLRVFANIGASEQTHMDSVLLLLTRYSLPDPAATTLPGQFGNPLLQSFYDVLMASGQASLVEALRVGAEIEDVDIRDLRAIKPTIDNADILLVYESLEKGSRNHLRAFHDNLLRQGATYTPKYLTQAEYDAIVNSPQERG
ncbi:MAG: DUF2202 domain-containing protein [Rubrivivax sp.]|nr:DUF2202 domain-containing protein [Rubrivivax sp.]